MGFLDRLAARRVARAEQRSASASGSLMRLLERAAGRISVTEERALAVPAIWRGYALITGTCAGLPLGQFTGSRIDATPRRLFTQPEPDVVPYVTFQRTVSDMLMYGAAFWQIVSVDAAGGVEHVKRLPAAEVTREDTDLAHVRYVGRTLDVSSPSAAAVVGAARVGDVIVFEQFPVGFLARAKDTIALAIALEATALHIAQTPLPSAALRNTGVDMTDEQIDALLARWDAARAEGATAFLQGPIELEKVSWSSKELQLVEARNQIAVQIARHLNVDPYHVGANLDGASMTYGNKTDMRNDLLDFTLADYLTPLGQRLSMADVTPDGVRVEYDVTDFTRPSVTDRVEMATSLVTAGVITTDEARDVVAYLPTMRGLLG